MSAVVLPFPAVLRSGFVDRHASRMAELSPISAERHLARQLRIQREAMERKGVAHVLIERQLRDLERAIRKELCAATIEGVR